MNKLKIVVFVITILFLCTNAYADNPSATEILEKVAATYKSMKTYKVEGTISIVYGPKQFEGVAEISFSILMKKPDQYLITWTQTNVPSSMGRSWAMWSDSTQPYFYTRDNNTFVNKASDKIALNRAKIYNGPFTIMPQLFLPVFKEYEFPFAWLKNPKVEKIEKIGEEYCYVIRGVSDISRSETIWVSKKSYLVRKYYRFRDYKDTIKLYSKYYEENKLGWSEKRFEEKIENIKRFNNYDHYTEVYKEISSPELSKEDFHFPLPKGAVLRDDPETRDVLKAPVKTGVR
ncbi:MAG: hypothetical protein GX654_13070 [Desulfatiglans sp.]|nr:hypothetical protein [Desulfatiglans sp.]